MKCFNCDKRIPQVVDDGEVRIYYCSACSVEAHKYRDGSVQWLFEHEGSEIDIDPTPESLAEAKAEYAEETGATL